MTRALAALAAVLLAAGCFTGGLESTHAPTTIPWARAEALLLAGDVVELEPLRDATVRLRLADGRQLVTDEPADGEALRLVERCGEPCKNVRIR